MQSINDLEDAIASKDVKRIEAATKQLNADLAILGTLQNQNIQLLSISSILAALKPADLINQSNLDEALRKILEMLKLLGGLGTSGATTGPTAITPKRKNPFEGQPKLEKLTGNESIEAIIEVSDAVTVLATVMSEVLDAANYEQFLDLVEFQKKLGDFGGYSADMNRGAGYGAGKVTVEIIDKTSGLIEVVQNAVQENSRYGNSLTYAGNI
jgi:hypothetical protein